MATDPQSIVDALDAAILAWAGKPMTLSFSGRSVTYATLSDLIAARDYYAQQVLLSTDSKVGFRLTKVRPGGAA